MKVRFQTLFYYSTIYAPYESYLSLIPILFIGLAKRLDRPWTVPVESGKHNWSL